MRRVLTPAERHVQKCKGTIPPSALLVIERLVDLHYDVDQKQAEIPILELQASLSKIPEVARSKSIIECIPYVYQNAGWQVKLKVGNVYLQSSKSFIFVNPNAESDDYEVVRTE